MTQGYTKGVPIDTDGTLSANSNQLVPSQAAVVTYVTSQIPVTPVTVPNGGTGAVSLTDHSVLLGAGVGTVQTVGPTATAGQVLQSAGLLSDPAFSTATYPLTTTINQLLYSSANDVVSGLTTAVRGVLTTGATGIPVITAIATDGQLIIGSTAGVPAAASLTAGMGVTITPGSNSITIAATGGGVTWTVITLDQAIVIGNGYICNKAGLLTLTLPATAAIGDVIKVTGINTAAGWKIAQNANQRIHIGTSSTTVGVTGSLASTNIRDTVTLVCVVAGASTEYNVISSMGNITVA